MSIKMFLITIIILNIIIFNIVNIIFLILLN